MNSLLRATSSAACANNARAAAPDALSHVVRVVYNLSDNRAIIPRIFALKQESVATRDKESLHSESYLLACLFRRRVICEVHTSLGENNFYFRVVVFHKLVG